MKYNPKIVSRNIAIFHFVIIGLLVARFVFNVFTPIYFLLPVLTAFILYELKLYWHIRDLVDNYENPNLVDNVFIENEKFEELLEDLKSKKRKHFNGVIRRSFILGITLIYVLISIRFSVWG